MLSMQNPLMQQTIPRAISVGFSHELDARHFVRFIPNSKLGKKQNSSKFQKTGTK